MAPHKVSLSDIHIQAELMVIATSGPVALRRVVTGSAI